MLDQMVEIVEREQPDVFLLSGDVYHTSQPSAAVQTMFTNAMVRIHMACSHMVIVATAGNHDSGTKHDVFRTPWQALQVFTVGNLDREHVENHIVEVPGKGFVVALPYAHERYLTSELLQQLLDMVAERNSKGWPVAMMAHTTVKGCDFAGHEHVSETTVGGIDALDVAQMGEGYDYLALGHIHKGQFVHTGKHNVRYSGSPLAVTFDEDYPHSVTMVEIDSHDNRPQVRTIEIKNNHPLVTLPEEGFADWDEAKRLLAEYADDAETYVRLNVTVADYLPTGAQAEAEALVKGKRCRFCHINLRRNEPSTRSTRTMTVQEFQAENPLDVALRYAENTDMAFDDEMKDLFKEAMNMVEQDKREQ